MGGSPLARDRQLSCIQVQELFGIAFSCQRPFMQAIWLDNFDFGWGWATECGKEMLLRVSAEWVDNPECFWSAAASLSKVFGAPQIGLHALVGVALDGDKGCPLALRKS